MSRRDRSRRDTSRLELGVRVRRIRDDSGMALVVVVLALVGLAALATGGFLLTRTDYEITTNHRGAFEAALVAQRGLARYLEEHRRPGPDTTYVFGQDTAVVTLTRLLESDRVTRDTVLRIESRGVHPMPGGGAGRRTVSQILLWGGEAKPFSAAAAAGKDMDLHDNDPQLSGEDVCGAAADVAGASVWSGGWHSHANQQVFGSPPVDSSYSSGVEVLEAADFDSATWSRLEAEKNLWPDVTISDSHVWPDFDTLPSDRWLVITFLDDHGKFEMQDGYSGRGAIIARDQFEVMKKYFSWDGIILAGGDLKLNSDGTVVEGAVLGGLDALLGGDGKKVDIDKKETRIQYSSCHAKVGSRITLRRLAVKPGTWWEAF